MKKQLIPCVFWYKSEYSAFGVSVSAPANAGGFLNLVQDHQRYTSSTSGWGRGYANKLGDGFGIPPFLSPLLLEIGG